MSITSTRPYAGSTPSFPLDQFFSGPLAASGIFCDRSRRVRNRFFMHLLGQWQGQKGTLEERFTFLDEHGAVSHADRIWSLEILDRGHFRGTAKGSAGDLVGIAEGASDGFAMHWSYTVRQPVGKKSYDLRTDDRMYRLNAERVINHSRMRYFGLFVGEAIIEIHRLPESLSERVHHYPDPEEYP